MRLELAANLLLGDVGQKELSIQLLREDRVQVGGYQEIAGKYSERAGVGQGQVGAIRDQIRVTGSISSDGMEILVE